MKRNDKLTFFESLDAKEAMNELKIVEELIGHGMNVYI